MLLIRGAYSGRGWLFYDLRYFQKNLCLLLLSLYFEGTITPDIGATVMIFRDIIAIKNCPGTVENISRPGKGGNFSLYNQASYEFLMIANQG